MDILDTGEGTVPFGGRGRFSSEASFQESNLVTHSYFLMVDLGMSTHMIFYFWGRSQGSSQVCFKSERKQSS